MKKKCIEGFSSDYQPTYRDTNKQNTVAPATLAATMPLLFTRSPSNPRNTSQVALAISRELTMPSLSLTDTLRRVRVVLVAAATTTMSMLLTTMSFVS